MDCVEIGQPKGRLKVFMSVFRSVRLGRRKLFEKKEKGIN